MVSRLSFPTLEFALEENDAINFWVVNDLFEAEPEFPTLDIKRVLALHMLSVCDVSVLDVKWNVDVDLALPAALERVVVGADDRVAEVDVADALVGVEEVELAELEDQHEVAVFLHRQLVLQPVFRRVALALVHLAVFGVLQSFRRQVRVAVWVVGYLRVALEVVVLRYKANTGW